MRTTEFSAIFGVIPGFDHDNDTPGDPVAIVARAWHEAALQERVAGGTYVGAALTERRVLYPLEKGSPEGGEAAVEAMGARNPRCEDAETWRTCVVRVAEATRRALRQATVRIVFREVDDHLLQDTD